MIKSISIQTEPFDTAVEIEKLRADNPVIGAIVTFLGLTRDSNEGRRVASMTLEHYAGMTEKALEKILSEAETRWQLQGIRVVHRTGELRPRDPIVLVAVASAHRGEAFQACEFVIDYLKTRAPLWKKEQTPEGGRWVEARHSDNQAERRWRSED